MHGDAPGSMSSVQELAPQTFAWMNKCSASLGEEMDSEREGENTYPFCRAILKEVERARCRDDSNIAELWYI